MSGSLGIGATTEAPAIDEATQAVADARMDRSLGVQLSHETLIVFGPTYARTYLDAWAAADPADADATSTGVPA